MGSIVGGGVLGDPGISLVDDARGVGQNGDRCFNARGTGE